MADSSTVKMISLTSSAAVILGVALGAMATMFGFASERSTALDSIAATKKICEDHESRIRIIEKQTDVIATNVLWIRSSLEYQHGKDSQDDRPPKPKP